MGSAELLAIVLVLFYSATRGESVYNTDEKKNTVPCIGLLLLLQDTCMFVRRAMLNIDEVHMQIYKPAATIAT